MTVQMFMPSNIWLKKIRWIRKIEAHWLVSQEIIKETRILFDKKLNFLFK